MKNTMSIASAFLVRDWLTDVSYRVAFAMQLVAVFLTLALFYYLSQIVDPVSLQGSGRSEEDYFSFVAVGLVLLEVITVSISSFARKIREEQMAGTLEIILASPVGTSGIVLASALYELLRACLSGLVVLIVAIVFFGLEVNREPLPLIAGLGALIGCIGLFASLGIAVGAFTIIFNRATGVLAFVVAGVALLGGVYFPLDVLPGVLEGIARALPFTWGVDAARAALLSGEVEELKLTGLAASAAILIPLALWGFRAAVQRARRTGTLSQY